MKPGLVARGVAWCGAVMFLLVVSIHCSPEIPTEVTPNPDASTTFDSITNTDAFVDVGKVADAVAEAAADRAADRVADRVADTVPGLDTSTGDQVTPGDRGGPVDGTPPIDAPLPDQTTPDAPPPSCAKANERLQPGQNCCSGLLDGGGVCIKPGSECKKAEDCGKPSCAADGAGCNQSLFGCHFGTCVKKEHKLRAATCVASLGYCEPKRCKETKDCVSGQPHVCTQRGVDCASSSVVCSDGVCTESQGVFVKGTCTAQGCRRNTCKSAADCGGGFCAYTERGCQESKPTCAAGTCQYTNATPVRTQFCNGKTGACETRSCSSSADCGSSCRPFAGSATRCVQYIHSCAGGQCGSGRSQVLTNMTCDVVLGKCVPLANRRCTSDINCTSKCSQKQNNCEEVSARCVAGVCQSSTTQKQNHACHPGLPYCVPLRCQDDASCGKPWCRNDSSGCTEHHSVCKSGTCLPGPSHSLTGATCDATSGLCVGRRCQADVDCGGVDCQGRLDDCAQTFSRCIQGSCQVTRTVMSFAVCDNGARLCRPRGACKVSVECGAPRCHQLGSNCLSVQPTCTGGACGLTQKTFANALCQMGSCVRPKACKTARDCAAQCSVQDRACVRISPRCDGAATGQGTCFMSVTATTPPSVCSPTGSCVTSNKACQGNQDCPLGPSCEQDGLHCIQKTPGCISRTCQFSRVTRKYATCDHQSGMCQERP